MGTISARVPDEIEDDLEAYLERENVDRSTAVRQLLAQGLAAWRRDRALDALAEGDVTLSRAAEMADTSVWELLALARDRDVTWVDDDRTVTDLDAL